MYPRLERRQRDFARSRERGDRQVREGLFFRTREVQEGLGEVEADGEGCGVVLHGDTGVDKGEGCCVDGS